MNRDNSIALMDEISPDLFEHMLAQGVRPCCSLVEPRTTLPVERSVPTLPRLRLAAKVDRPITSLALFGLPILRDIGR